MSSAEARPVDAFTRPGVLNFLEAGTESSLFRNGRVYTRRDGDGSDSGYVGVNLTACTLDVSDARALSGATKMTCETNGFELLDAPLEDASLDFLDQEQVVGRYYRECEQLVAGSTGALALAFDHNVRSASGKRSARRIAGGQAVQGPAKVVHGDYTLYSAPQRLRDLASPPGNNDTLRTVLGGDGSLVSRAMMDNCLSFDGRFAIINVWRNIAPEPVQTNPMAMCDGQTVEPEDLVTFEIHYADRVGENYFAKHDARQRFYFFPEMTRDEPMLLKQWDSDGGLARSGGQASDASIAGAPCTFSFHSAFDDLMAPADAPDRWSVEVRCIVIY